MAEKQLAETFDTIELPAFGQPFAGGYFAGEFVLDGDRFALVLAPKAKGEQLEAQYKVEGWRTADGADSDDDGLANSELINNANHPAAYFCQSLSIDGYDDWYLPSRDELAMLWRNLGPRRKKTPELFRKGGAEAFAEQWYWSSTENGSYSYYAWSINFDSGGQFNDVKDSNFGVRAVRREIPRKVERSVSVAAKITDQGDGLGADCYCPFEHYPETYQKRGVLTFTWFE